MPVFTRKQFNDYLHDPKVDKSNQVYLIYGDRLLTNQLFKKILDTTLPKSIGDFNTESFDGNSNKDIIRLINSINTFSLSQNGKLIILHNLKELQSQKNYVKTKSKANRNPGDNITSMEGESVKNNFELKFSNIIISDDNDITSNYGEKYYEDKKLSVQKDSLLIENIITEGLLGGHYFILLSDTVDKDTSLFKTIATRGIVIDCFIPKNRTRSNQKFHKSLIYELIDKILSENEKTIDVKAYEILYNMTDFDLDALSKNFMRLINYIGERKHITVKDVVKLLEKTRKDPIFTLTNTIVKQDLMRSLFCLDSLLSNNVHPLQILTSISNKIRRLILAKNFIFHDKNQTWKKDQTFTYFKMNTLRSIEKYDESTRAVLNEGKNVLGSTKEGSGYVSSLTLLENRNPYAVYVTMLEANKLKQSLLFDAIKVLRAADEKLKLSVANPKNILESVIFSICNFLKK